MLPHADGEVLDDEVVIIHSSGSTGEPEVFEPYTGVRLPGVPGDVGGRTEALWERCFLDATTKCQWPQAVRARALGVRSATMPGVRVLALLDGQARARAACSHRYSIDVIVSGVASIVDDAASVMVWPDPFAHMWSVWSGHRVGLRRSRDLLLHTRQLLW